MNPGKPQLLAIDPQEDFPWDRLSVPLAQLRVLVFPTDTLYGLGCRADHDIDCQRVVDIKGRAPDQPFPLLVADLAMAQEYAEFSSQALELAERWWPGALTLVLPARADVSRSGALRTARLGLRVPALPAIRDLIARLSVPLVGTSANRSGAPPAISCAELDPAVGQEADLVLDGGCCSGGQPSSVVEACGEQLRLLRAGALDGVQLGLD